MAPENMVDRRPVTKAAEPMPSGRQLVSHQRRAADGYPDGIPARRHPLMSAATASGV